jgi:hypothetical protein
VLFGTLYPKAAVEIDNQARNVHLVSITARTIRIVESMALRCSDHAQPNEVLGGEVLVVARTQPQSTIVIAGIECGETASIPLATVKSTAGTHPSEVRQKMLQRLDGRLFIDGRPVQDLTSISGISTGQDLVSSTASSLPTVGTVTPSSLGLEENGKKLSCTSGVYLCYGFVMHGASLAPGVGRAVANSTLGFGEHVKDEDGENTLAWVPTHLGKMLG